ncbi:MAG TPA: SPOR domain-containing protein [Cryomorphaceae bacterium]|nr:SPOR domain-containing protein [Cryomorphaceae bacterium]
MSKSTLTLVITSLVCISSVQGQDEGAQSKERIYSGESVFVRDSLMQENKKGKITVYEDERITELNQLKKEYPGHLDGYRVQIFFGKRSEALEQKARFSETHPELPAYISYLAPNFRLRVGDFRTKLEGEKLKKEIESDYPGCYLVKDKIELPALEKEETIEADSKWD